MTAAVEPPSLSAPRVSVILPTYQERANVKRAVRDASAALAGVEHEILVVDDGSPDGTADAAESVADEGVPVRVVRRVGERGLASAVLEGFRRARGDILVVMDADGSHPPALLPRLVAEVERGADVSVASRYAPGGGVEGWPWRRRATSRIATRLAAHLTPVRDPMSGYFAARREVVQGAPLDPRGFKIGLDVLVRGRYESVTEVPFVFRDRERGKSKLKSRVYVEYIRHLWELTRVANPVAFQAAKYLIVGAMGMLVNLAAFSALAYGLGLGNVAAAVGSFGIAVAFNFALNKLWTFRDRVAKAPVVARQLAAFLAVAVVGLGINLAVLEALAGWLGAHRLVAQGAGILVAAAWNFEGSRRFSFRVKGPKAL